MINRCCASAGVLGALLLFTGLARAESEAQPLALRVAALKFHQPLPRAVSNNAVSALNGELFSLLGLTGERSHDDIVSWHFRGRLVEEGEAGPHWRSGSNLPVDQGRLAASAVALGNQVLLFGGYTVAADGSEVSTPEVFAIDAQSDAVIELAPMPVPVDDAVVLPFQDRYVYLISGWHDLANVNLVQIYDRERNSWQQGTAFPGDPVFGHAGGIVADEMVICDGVRIELLGEGKRSFAATDACFHGRIDSQDHRRIAWSPLPGHPGPARYRMAATGAQLHGPRVVFAGGSDNPYNYDGIGYDGQPSQPGRSVFSYDLKAGQWQEHGDLTLATMDHRGLPVIDGRLFIIGGMLRNQVVSNRVLSFTLQPAADQP